MTLRCVICGRSLRTAAATMPAVETGPMPHPAGAVGPTCARNAGLLKPSLFTRKVQAVKRMKRLRQTLQADWVAGS
jgi:hypothetical protein